MYASTRVIASLAAIQGVRAWGSLGHATVAYIAQNYVSESTASWAQKIIGNDLSDYMALNVSWPDDYDHTPAGKFSNEGCIVSAVANYTQRVRDTSLEEEQVREALIFLIHFLGDATQPLHNEDIAQGGNQIHVKFNHHSTNLHAVWDSFIPEQLVGGYHLSNAQRWAQSLTQRIDDGDYQSQAAAWIEGDDIKKPEDSAMLWARDSNAFVCTVVMPNGVEPLQDHNLYPEYYESAISTVELQIAKGGYRLANWLNMLADSMGRELSYAGEHVAQDSHGSEL
ncbi:putative nuclease PA3 [Xylariaceae sp. AK1471]|nr:putative nuclease PA3 [Xylariaceae sp. AK1471]